MQLFKLSFLFTALFFLLPETIAIPKEQRFAELDPEIIALVDLHPGEIVIRKRDYLVSIGMRKVLEWSDSSLLSSFEDYTGYISTYAMLGADRYDLLEKGQDRIRLPIQDPVLFTIMVSVMLHGIGNPANEIYQYGRRDHIYAFSEHIKRHLYSQAHKQSLQYIREVRLFALCNLSQNEKDTILERFSTNIDRGITELRAWYGDTAAQSIIVSGFKNSAKFWDKAGYAQTLAKTGTDIALRTLVKGLQCTLYYDDGSARRHIRVPILQALYLAFPDETLFLTIPYNTRRDDRYTREEIVKYMHDLKKWARETFKIELDLDEETFYLRRYLGDIYPDFDPYTTPHFE